MATAAMAFAPAPKAITTYPPTQPDCFGDDGSITPCPTSTLTSTTVKPTTTHSPVKECINDYGNFIPCPISTGTSTSVQSTQPDKTPVKECINDQGNFIPCLSTVAAKCWDDRGFETSCHSPTTYSLPCTTELTPTVITFGTTTITLSDRTFAPITTPVTATFCLSPEGHSSECTISTGSATTSSCSGSYFNGACQCPCGAVCSCAAPTMITGVISQVAY